MTLAGKGGPSPLLTIWNYANYKQGDVVIITDIKYPEPDYDSLDKFSSTLYTVTHVDSIFSLQRCIWLYPLLEKPGLNFSCLGSESRPFILAYVRLQLAYKG